MNEFAEAFVFLQAGSDPAKDRVVHEHSGSKTLLVWVPDGEAAARVSAELAEAGVRLIELYRGFGLDAAAQVMTAVAGRAPVGVAGFAFGSFPGPELGHSVTIYAAPDADPAVDRVVRPHAGGGRTTVVGAGRSGGGRGGRRTRRAGRRTRRDLRRDLAHHGGRGGRGTGQSGAGEPGQLAVRSHRGCCRLQGSVRGRLRALTVSPSGREAA